MKDPFKVFNLSEFKKWMNESNEDDHQDNLLGSQVESKINIKKLIEVCEIIDGEEKKVLKEFANNGGIVLSKNENIILIENKKGKFEIHKMYIKLS